MYVCMIACLSACCTSLFIMKLVRVCGRLGKEKEKRNLDYTEKQQEEREEKKEDKMKTENKT